MIISRTTSGQIVSGTVLKWKPGSGSAADRLTILTIDGGDRETQTLNTEDHCLIRQEN